MSQAAKQAGTGALSGAATGATTGMMFGPYGAAIGAGVGAVAGGLGGYFKGKGDDDRAKDKKAAWAKAQETLARSRADQIAARGRLIEQAYSPASNMLGQMYGKQAQPGMQNPLGGTPQAGMANPTGVDAGPADERYINGVKYGADGMAETKLKKPSPDQWGIDVGEAQLQQWSPTVGEAEMKKPPQGRPRGPGPAPSKGRKKGGR